MIFRRVDIVHVHGGNIVSLKRKLVFLKISNILRKKTIYHHHGGNLISDLSQLSIWWQSMIGRQLRNVDVIICLSETLKRQLEEMLPGITCQVVSNGVPVPVFNRSSYISCKQPLNLSFMGLIHRNKGIFDLIEVAERLIANGLDVRLSICGSGDVDEIQKTIRQLKMEEKICYCGYITGKQKDIFFREADIFILPSYSEAMPMVILEAMSYALPVVSTWVGAIPELVDNDVTGYLVQPGDLLSLYNRLSKLINDPEKQENFGNRGRKIVEIRYDINEKSQRLKEIYNSL